MVINHQMTPLLLHYRTPLGDEHRSPRSYAISPRRLPTDGDSYLSLEVQIFRFWSDQHGRGIRALRRIEIIDGFLSAKTFSTLEADEYYFREPHNTYRSGDQCDIWIIRIQAKIENVLLVLKRVENKETSRLKQLGEGGGCSSQRCSSSAASYVERRQSGVDRLNDLHRPATLPHGVVAGRFPSFALIVMIN